MAVRRVGKRRVGMVKRRKPVVYGRGVRRALAGRQAIQFFKRSQYITGGWTVQGGASIRTYNPTFQLTNLPDFNEFQGLYDQFCIKAIKINLINRGNSVDSAINSTTPAVTGQSALVALVLDYTDANPLASFNEATQYESMKMSRGWQGHNRYFVPAIQAEANQSSTTVGLMPKKRQWLTTSSTTGIGGAIVPHFGVKFIADSTGVALGNQVTFDVKITYYLAFKNVK